MDLPTCNRVVMRRDEWLNYRRSKIGGSDAAAIYGVSPFRTQYQVWVEKKLLAAPDDISDLPRVEWGTRLEGIICDKFEQNHPEFFIRRPSSELKVECLQSKERPWAIATLDAELYQHDEPVGILEIKTAHYPGAKQWGESGSGASGVPVYYLCQVYHYLAVTGLKKAWVAVLIDGYDYREYEIERSEADVKETILSEDSFWHTFIEGNEVPRANAAQQNPGDDTFIEGTIDQLEAIERWRGLVAQGKECKAQADDLAAFLKQTIGESKGLEFDTGKLTWVRGKRKKVDRKAMQEDDPVMLAAYRELEEAHTITEIRDMGLRWKEAK